MGYLALALIILPFLSYGHSYKSPDSCIVQDKIDNYNVEDAVKFNAFIKKENHLLTIFIGYKNNWGNDTIHVSEKTVLVKKKRRFEIPKDEHYELKYYIPKWTGFTVNLDMNISLTDDDGNVWFNITRDRPVEKVSLQNGNFTRKCEPFTPTWMVSSMTKIPVIGKKSAGMMNQYFTFYSNETTYTPSLTVSCMETEFRSENGRLQVGKSGSPLQPHKEYKASITAFLDTFILEVVELDTNIELVRIPLTELPSEFVFQELEGKKFMATQSSMNQDVVNSPAVLNYTWMFYIFLSLSILLLFVVGILSSLIFVLRKRFLLLKRTLKIEELVESAFGAKTSPATQPSVYLEPLPFSAIRPQSIHIYEEIDEEFVKLMLQAEKVFSSKNNGSSKKSQKNEEHTYENNMISCKPNEEQLQEYDLDDIEEISESSDSDETDTDQDEIEHLREMLSVLKTKIEMIASRITSQM